VAKRDIEVALLDLMSLLKRELVVVGMRRVELGRIVCKKGENATNQDTRIRQSNPPIRT
jgi:hypothetical protein